VAQIKRGRGKDVLISCTVLPLMQCSVKAPKQDAHSNASACIAVNYWYVTFKKQSLMYRFSDGVWGYDSVKGNQEENANILSFLFRKTWLQSANEMSRLWQASTVRNPMTPKKYASYIIIFILSLSLLVRKKCVPVCFYSVSQLRWKYFATELGQRERWSFTDGLHFAWVDHGRLRA